MKRSPDVDESVLEEGCYHLSKLGLAWEEIAGHFEITPDRAESLGRRYESKLGSGTASAGSFDRTFWEDVMKEAEGDVKVTFVSERGFHHAWKSELARLDGRALMTIYEASKDFLASDPNRRFLDVPPPKGFDPLALDREVSKAVVLVAALLEAKWKEEGADRPEKSRTNLQP